MAKTSIVPAFPKKELGILILTKLGYILFICVLPLSVLNITFGQWFLGFLVMHCTAGIILSTVFQLAHVVEGAAQPSPDEKGNIENAWAIHQLNTTANFSGRNKILSWSSEDWIIRWDITYFQKFPIFIIRRFLLL